MSYLQPSSRQNLGLPALCTSRSTFGSTVIGETFYPDTVGKVLPTLGVQKEYPLHFRSSLEIISSSTGINFGSDTIDSLDLLLTGLTKVERFRMTYHLQRNRGEHTGAHCCMTALLGFELIRRAGIFNQECDYRFKNKISSFVILASLIHDIGESAGEISSLSQRAQTVQNYDSEDLENIVANLCFKMSLQDPKDPNSVSYIATVTKLRQQFSFGSDASIPLDKAFEDVKALEGSIQIAPKNQYLLDEYKLIFSAIEHDQGCDLDRFLGSAVKIIEHIQGTRHYTRFFTLDPNAIRLKIFGSPSSSTIDPLPTDHYDPHSVPNHLGDSYRIIRSLKYNEDRVDTMFLLLDRLKDNTNYLLLESFAKTIRDALYESIIEQLAVGPNLVNLQANKSDSVFNDLCTLIKFGKKNSSGEYIPLEADELEKAKLTLIEHCQARDNAYLKEHRSLRAARYERNIEFSEREAKDASKCPYIILPIETKHRLMRLYLWAIKADFRSKLSEILPFSDFLDKGFAFGLDEPRFFRLPNLPK